MRLALLAWAAAAVWAIADDSFVLLPPGSTNVAGSTIQLSVTQDGQVLAQSFDFQWSKDGINLADDGRITGTTTPVLTVLNSQLADSGDYAVSLWGTNTLEASVYVVSVPAIQSLTDDTSGLDVTFTVAATGGLLAYQWTWQGNDIPGATNSVLAFVDAYATANAGYYAVRVSNPAGTTLSSTPGLLFTKPAPAGTYQGLFYETNAVAPGSSGFFQYTLAGSERAFSGKITLGARHYSFSGKLSVAHDAEVSVRRPNDTPLTLKLQLLTTNDLPQVIGSVSDGTWTAQLQGNRLYFNSKNPTPLAGTYTLSFQNTNSSPLAPNGAGYAAVRVRANGAVALSGQAADGSAIAGNFGLARLGDWPLYVSLNRARGCLIGWLQLAIQTNSSIQSSGVTWTKTAGPDKLYPDGFYLALQPVGSAYSLATNGVPLLLTNGISLPLTNGVPLMLTNGVALFYAGDLFSNDLAVWDFVNVVPLRPNVFAGEGDRNLRLAIKPSSGVISGRFTDFTTGRSTPVKGIVLQQQNSGSGYFISGAAAGNFNLTSSP